MAELTPREQREQDARDRGIVFEDLENQRTTEAGGLPVWGEDYRPFDKETFRKPAKKVDFVSRFKETLDHPKFQQFQPEQQRQFVNRLFDADERLAHLTPEQRGLFLGKVTDKFRRDYEHSTSIAGQVEDVLGHKLSPGMKMLTDEFEAIPGTGAVTGYTRSAAKSIGAAIASWGTKAEMLMKDELPPPEPTGDERFDAERMATWEKLSKRKTAEFMQPLVDGVEQLIELQSRNKELGQAFMDMAERAPVNADRASLDSWIKQDTIFGSLVEGTGMVTNTLADSLGIMLPALATGNSPKAVLGAMQFVHSGLQQDAARDAGVELEPGAQEFSGLVQAALGMAAGPEAAVVGRQGSDLIGNLMRSGFKRAFSRVAAGMGTEAATEFTQEYINQQLPEWSDGNKGFWNNLEPDQQKEIIQGAILAPLAAAPFEAVGAGAKGEAEADLGRRGSEIQRRIELAGKSPEERGRAKQLTLQADQEMSEEEENNFRFERLPEFLQKEVEAGDTERAEAFARGEFIAEPHEDEAVAEAEAKIKLDLYGPAPVPVELEGRRHRQMLEAIKNHTLDTAANLVAQGKQKAGDQLARNARNVTFVEPTDAPEHEWMRELQGYAESQGSTLVFYDSPGMSTLASGGIITHEGNIGVRYQPKGKVETASSVFLHELTHNIGRRSPVIERHLMGVMAEAFPDKWAEVDTKLDNIEEQRGKKMGPQEREREHLAHFVEANGNLLFRHMAEIAADPDIAKDNRGVRKLLEEFANWIERLIEAVPGLKHVIPVMPTEERAKRKAIIKAANAMADALEQTKTGERPEKVVKPKKLKVEDDIWRAKMVEPGQSIAITRGIGGVVTAVEKDGTDVKITMESGEVHILPENQILRGVLEAPVTPPKAKSPPVVPEKAPEEAPATAPETPAPDKGKPVAAKEPKPTERGTSAPVEATPEQGTFDFSDTYWHFGADVSGGIRRDFAGMGAAGRESARFKKDKAGKIDPESAAIHLYLPGRSPEPKVVSQSIFLNRVVSDMRLMDINSQESKDIAAGIDKSGEEHIEEYIKQIKAKGYDGIVDYERGMAQVYRDIGSEEVVDTKEMTRAERKAFLQKKKSDRRTLSMGENEATVEEIEASGQMSDVDVEWHLQDGTSYSGKIKDAEGVDIADIDVVLQFQGTEDETVFFDWIGATGISPFEKAGGQIGVRSVLAIRQQLQESFPNAKFVSGLRVGGTHAMARGPEHDPMIRIPIHTKAQRTRMGIKLPPARSQSELMMIYGHDSWYGQPDTDWDEPSRDEGADAAIQEGYDDDPDVIFEQLDNDEELVEYLRQQAKDDVFRSEVLLSPDDGLQNWGAVEWNKFGNQYGVENLGGMGKMVKVGKVEVPGGTDGKWTYQELLHLKAAAIDPEEAWTEEEHVAIQKKLSRSLAPPATDNLQIFNNFIFAILSNGLNLTLNEIGYSLVRVENQEEVAEWAARIPWDVTEGEVPSRATYDAMDKAEQANFQEWLKDFKGIKTKAEKIEDRSIGTLIREYYDRKIVREFGMGTKSESGMGLGQMKYHLTDIAGMAQFFQRDPDWFPKGDTESWYHYSNRLASQFRGMSFKIAIFGAVWQDPINAAVSAVDRHMAVILREEIFTDPIKRKAFEDKVAREWTKKRGGAENLSIDEIMQEEGGTGFIGQILLEKISQPIKRKYDKSIQDFSFLKDPERLRIMSREYKNALQENIREGKRLGLGVFATQHLLWDRQRRRFEPHASQFPGLYKVPKMTQPKLRDVLARHKAAGTTGTRHEMVEKDGRRESRLKRPRSAPPGDLAFVSEAPAAFERGTTRHQITNASDIQPLGSIDPETGPMWVIPDESWLGWIKRKIQDKFFRVEQLQDAVKTYSGANIRDEMDTYLAEMLYHGKAADQIERFEEEFVKPLMQLIRDESIDITEFEEWLHAKHAEERNDHLSEAWYSRVKDGLEQEIAALESDREYHMDQGGDGVALARRINKRRRQLRDLETAHIPDSGMTTDDANIILAAAGDKFDAVGAVFRTMMDRKLQIFLDAGMITKKQYDDVNQYENYVPLKGKNYDGDLEELLESAGAGTGRGFDIRGDELGFAFGRKEGDRHTHPILSQAITDIEEAIVRSEKNEVGKAFLAFAREYPNEAAYTINKRVKRRVWDKDTGTIKLVEDALAKKADNVLAVKEDGETFYITIADSRLASALKNIGSGKHGWPVRVMGAANRLLAKINTTLNPEFMVSNFARDLQTAITHLNDKDAQGMTAQVLGNLPSAMRGIAGAEFLGKNETEWQQAYDDFKANGGKIGFFGYNDVVSKARALQRMVRRNGPGVRNMSYRQLTKLGSLVEAGNTVVENGIRLATYKTAVDNGMSKKRAAALARNLTVNFNKKGEVGSFINSVWLFSNASIQGTARMIRAMKSSRRVRGVAASMFTMSFIQGLLARGMGGDDDEDGYSYWEKLPEWQKENNFIVMLPGTEGDHIKIPLPYGYNIFNVLGNQAADLAYKSWTGKGEAADVPKAGLEVFNAMIGAFNPLGSQRIDSAWGLLRFAAPSVTAPIVDTLVNETYYGAPIQPTRSSWDKSPDSQRYFQGVSETSRKLSGWANEMTGGNAYQPGIVDFNPEVLDYIVSSYAGAGAKTGKRILFDGGAWLWRAGKGDISKPAANDVAFLRRVYGEENDHTVASMYYENAEEIEQAQTAWENLSKDPAFDKVAWRRRHGWKRRVFDDLSKAQKAIRKADDPEEKNKIRKRFNRSYRKAWESQF